MHTVRRFCELVENTFDYPVEPCREYDGATTFALESASLARVIALAEVLGMSRESLVAELIDSALGDAHDGFLSAYVDTVAREQANERLKQRVKALLQGFLS